VSFLIGENMAIAPGSYDPTKLSQAERQSLWQHFGHAGEAPVGYGGEGGAGGAGVSGAGVSGMGNWQDIVRQAQQMAQQAIQPQVQALEAREPQVESRYQQLLQDITQTTRGAATAEFGRRGIPLSSGIVESTVGQRLAPQIAQAGVVKEAGLSDIQQAIAALQGGALGAGMTGGIDLYSAMQGARENAARLALDQLKERQLQEQRLWERPYQEREYEYGLGKPYYKPETGAVDPDPFPTFDPTQTFGIGSKAQQIAMQQFLPFLRATP